jgi:hypothetical protein
MFSSTMVVSANASPKTKSTNNDKYNDCSFDQKQESRIDKQDLRTNEKDFRTDKQDLRTYKKDYRTDKQEVCTNTKDACTNTKDTCIDKNDTCTNLKGLCNSKCSNPEVKETNVEYLETVAKYSPELVNSYKTALENKDELKVAISNTRSTIKTTYRDKTMAELEVVKTDLYAKVKAGEITTEEARQSIKTFMIDSLNTYKASKAAYKVAILAASNEWESKAIEIKSIQEDLRTATEAEDANTAAVSIQKLYTYLIEYNELVQFKLDTMNAMF